MQNDLLKILKNWSLYKEWKKIKKGNKVTSLYKGAGYYSTKSPQIWDMKSGKKMIVELVDVEYFHDPSDMIERSFWHAVGYVGEKPLKDMSFEEFYLVATGKPLCPNPS